MNLSAHFRLSEFACPCGCGGEWGVTALLVVALEQLRYQLGDAALIVTSGFRCLGQNRSIGSQDTSQHVVGRAADIVCATFTPGAVAKAAAAIELFGKGGIGIYDGFTHVDVRPHGPARWDFRKKENV
jgi:uncharacterized protein YcbK (DUF882 family)